MCFLIFQRCLWNVQINHINSYFADDQNYNISTMNEEIETLKQRLIQVETKLERSSELGNLWISKLSQIQWKNSNIVWISLLWSIFPQYHFSEKWPQFCKVIVKPSQNWLTPSKTVRNGCPSHGVFEETNQFPMSKIAHTFQWRI